MMRIHNHKREQLACWLGLRARCVSNATDTNQCNRHAAPNQAMRTRAPTRRLSFRVKLHSNTLLITTLPPRDLAAHGIMISFFT